MVVVAGPSGSGKSALFPIQKTGLDWFSVDDRCAELNGGSYVAIPPKIRQRAGLECEAFIAAHIDAGTSFAVESTLRTLVAIGQAVRARARGFRTFMEYVATDDVEINLVRVTARAFEGGHSAPAERVREIYKKSLENVVSAIRAFDHVRLIDNTPNEGPARLVARFRNGHLVTQVADPPAWCQAILDLRWPSALEPAGRERDRSTWPEFDLD